MNLQAQKNIFKASRKKRNKAILEEDFDLLVQYCKDGKCLYNFLLFVVRQQFFKQRNQKYNTEFIKEYKEFPLFQELLIRYFEQGLLFSNDLSRIACRFSELQGFCFNTKVSQGIYRQLHTDFQSYFAIIAAKKERSDIGKINLPRYKRKECMAVTLNRQVISNRLLKQGYLGPANCKQGFRISSSKITEENLQAIELRVQHDCLIATVLYQVSPVKLKTLKEVDLEHSRVCGIDTGVHNLFTIAFNFDQKPLTLRNGYLKSVNQWYNKETSRLKSLLPKGVYSSKKIRSITRKRNETITNRLNHHANAIVAMIKELGIEVVVIGKTPYWKQNPHHIGGNKKGKVKKNKPWIQPFVQLPIAQFIDRLQYKLERENIVVLIQEESYTSKASFLDEDPIPTYSKEKNEMYVFSGYRQTRGNYKIKGKDQCIHSDVNGAYNIMRKAGFAIKKENLSFLEKKYIYPLSFESYVKETSLAG